MIRFTQLYRELDRSNRTRDKLQALRSYFEHAPAEDAAWALYFLTGNKVPRAVNTRHLREWAAEASGMPLWLVEECYDTVGDLAETMALLLPRTEAVCRLPLHRLVEERLLPLKECPEDDRKAVLIRTWAEMDLDQRFIWNKLITGAFRLGVARTLVVRALSEVAGIPRAEMAHRIMGEWSPTADLYRRLRSPQPDAGHPARPYPFYLAYALEDEPAALGRPCQWQAEWKWDGIRAQMIHRRGEVIIWTRGEEMVGDRYPEVRDAARTLPEGVVLDGEILAWRGDQPLPFGDLQKRIGRRKPGKKLLADTPVAFQAYDLLEWDGLDQRSLPLYERRARLETLELSDPLCLSPTLSFDTWADLEGLQAQARARNVEGIMLKRRDSVYGVGREKGPWWKWKVEPFTMDVVLMYAQRGHGRRSSLYTDYTFGAWEGDRLVPVAKAYSGLTDAEIRRVDAYVRRHTIERHGPVRVVKPELVFELAFEGIRESSRHKSGIAVRFPRMARWREDKRPDQADRLETLRRLL